MYEAFYGLREKPFSILPDPEMIYWGQNHRLAFAMLEFGVMNSAGFTVITGEIGSGKTTLVRYLLRRLDSNFSVGLMSNTPQGREELLQWILMSLDQPFEGAYPVLFARFREYLHAQYQAGRRTILIIDEAQNLKSDALESLRMLSNVNAEKDQFLQLILVGQPQLKNLLCAPELVQFAQRVSADFHLKPLSGNEIAQYIDCRLTAVGARLPVFSAEACAVVAKASSGIPRTINILCDTALVYGFAMQAEWITKQIVEEVIEQKRTFGVFGQCAVGINNPRNDSPNSLPRRRTPLTDHSTYQPQGGESQ
jgi:general secretion pathway protein A